MTGHRSRTRHGIQGILAFVGRTLIAGALISGCSRLAPSPQSLLPMGERAAGAPTLSIPSDEPASPDEAPLERVKNETMAHPTPLDSTWDWPEAVAGKTELVAQRTGNGATFDMGNGEYALVQNSQPMHYQDDAGQWQRIDPAFALVEGGWRNSTNALRTGLSARSSKASVALADAHVGWEPRSLQVVDSAGATIPWATALDDTQAQTGTLSADGRTVAYARSWSDGAIQDQWRSDFGHAEYSLRMETRPPVNTAAANDESALELSVSLRVLPGMHVEVDGRPVTPDDLPLETQGTLAFVPDSGETLWLQPPQAYEAQHAATRVAGSYKLAAGADAHTFELGVRLPVAWLAAPDRDYPVVLDPAFQVKWPVNVKVAVYDILNNNAFSWGGTTPIGLGQYPYGVTRAIISFTLPTMPPDATITEATLQARPSAGKISCSYSLENTDVCWASVDRQGLTAQVEAFPLTSGSPWTTGAEPQYNPSDTLGARTMSWSSSVIDTASWDITNLINTQWLAGNNTGILLKLVDENCYVDRSWGYLSHITVRSFPDGCGWFDLPNPTNYTVVDPVHDTMRPAIDGIWLFVRYTAHILNVGDEVTIPTDNPLDPSGLPSNSKDYFNADHEYQLATMSTLWRVASVRGLGRATGDPNVPDLHDAYIRPLQGRMLTKVWDEDSIDINSMEGAPGSVDYVVLDGPAHSGEAPRLRLRRSADTQQPRNYQTGLYAQTGSLVLSSAPTSRTVQYVYTTTTPVALWNIQMPAGSVSRVDVTILHDQVRGVSETHYFDLYSDDFRATLFKSGSGSAVLSPLDGSALEPAGSDDQHLVDFVNPGSGDRYALALAYQGPYVKVHECAGSTPEFPCSPVEIFDLAFTVQIRVTSCQPGEIPLAGGQCQKVECPNNSFLAANYKETDDFGLWSASGWTDTQSNAGDAVLLGPPRLGLTRQPPTIVAGGATIVYDGDDVSIRGMPGDTPSIWLVNCGTLTNPNDPVVPNFGTQVYLGPMTRALIAGEGSAPGLIPDRVDPKTSGFYQVWQEKERSLLSDGQLYILPNANGGSVIKATAHYEPNVQGDNTSTAYTIPALVKWQHNWQGWSRLETTAEPDGAPDTISIAGMLLDVGSTFSMDVDESRVTPNFATLRARAATLTHQPDMGGASKPLQVVILPKGESVLGTGACLDTKNCIDLRAPDDAYPGPLKRTWAMPDIHITGNAGMVMLNAPGQMRVWSKDHPSLANSPQAVGQEFSFDTFKGSVSIQYEKCSPGDTKDVQVVRGETQIALPMVGDGASPDSMVAARFKLCASPDMALREVEFEFRSPVGVPVGSSGLFANGMKGTVEMRPSSTRIAFSMDFYYGSPDTLQGTGTVVIDTQGLFEFQGSGKILGVVDASGRLWVAWNPLDTGFEMGLHYGLGDIASIDGTVRAHAWQGRGWQDKYAWLPDDGANHFAAQIEATFTIYEGAVLDIWPLVIPPVDLDRSLELAFGQFCTNGSCSEYEWGIKAALSVCGYTVGVYYGFDHGVDLILGNDGHVLIDQYGGGALARNVAGLVAGRDAVRLDKAPQAVNGTVDIPITITADTEEFLVAMGWQTGTPSLNLYNLSGALVVSSTAYSVFVSNTTAGGASSKLIGVRLAQPASGLWQPGVWTARITNVSGPEHFKFAFLANKGGPGIPSERGHFIMPGPSPMLVSGPFTITWSVPAGTSPSATISLDYSAYTYDYGVFHEVTQTQHVPIVRNHPFISGTYTWDTAGVAYANAAGRVLFNRIRAVVDDGVNSFPEGNLDDPCQPATELPESRAFDANRFPGTFTFSAEGELTITDTVPPARPTGVTLHGLDGAILAKWNPSPEKDLAAYLVQWGAVTYNFMLHQYLWVGGAPSHAERVAPVLTPTQRIGGLSNELPLNQSYGVVVSAIDVNGNTSPSTTITVTRPATGTAAQVPLAPVTPTLIMTSSTSATIVSGSYTDSGVPACFRVVYRQPITFEQTMQVDHIAPASNIPGFTLFTVTLTHLQPGATYEVWASAANADGWHSALSAPLRFIATNSVDANHNGLPDDWEAAHALTSYGDADRDLLGGYMEYYSRTDPKREDTDGDGFTDGEERSAGSDPLDRNVYPAAYTHPRLELNRDEITVRVKNSVVAVSTGTSCFNVGGGTMQIVASTTSTWMTPTTSNTPCSVGFNMDPRVLAPGFHSGVIRVNVLIEQLRAGEQASQQVANSKTRCLRVNVYRLPADDDIPLYRRVYLPVARKN